MKSRNQKTLFAGIIAALLLIGGAFWYFSAKNTCAPDAKCCKDKTSTACGQHESTTSIAPGTETPSASKPAPTSCSEKEVVTCNHPAASKLAVEPVANKSKEELALNTTPKKVKPSKERRIKEALEYEKRKTMDPALGYVPKERRALALQQALARQEMLQKEGFYAQRSASITNARWHDRGPSNVAGRTRAILIDLNDPTGKTVYAGSATGGLWRTCNINADVTQWEQISSIWPSMAIGGMAQDPNDPKYIYVGTGDNIDVQGFGVYRSDNGGETFVILPSTTNSQWDYVQEVAVNPVNSDVYLATDKGVWRSTNRGDTWQSVFPSSFICDLEITRTGRVFFATNATIYRSETGNSGSYTNLNTKPGFVSGFSRVEFSIGGSEDQVIFMVGADGGDASAIRVSADGGDSWSQRTMAQRDNGVSFATPQAWYDLDIMVNPNDPTEVYVGGIDLFKSSDGGFSWSRISNWTGGEPQYVHADQHYMKFSPYGSKTSVFGHDGGISITNDAESSLPDITTKIENLNSTTFYAMGMDPGFMSGKFIAGAQDNGTNIVSGPAVGRAREIIGGDGFFCFIDQNEPNILIGSLYDGEWSSSSDGGQTLGGGVSTNSGFVTMGDYDDNTNILYGQTFNADYFFWQVGSGSASFVNVPGLNTSSNMSAIFVDPNVANRIYIGTFNGGLYRLDNANTMSPTLTTLAQLQGAISGIDVAPGNSDRMLVCSSSYGVAQSIRLSTNGGVSFVGVEGSAIPNNLPDMPVRWCLFNPFNTDQAFIATEAGVWTTENLNGDQTAWIPPVPGRGTNLVRTDMLQYRASDHVIGAATFGNGIWTTGVLSDAYAVASYPQVHYVGAPLTFNAEQTIGDANVLWTFDDGTTSDQIITSHVFETTGPHVVKLSVNGGEDVDEKTVEVLSTLPTPYTGDMPNYGGDFETLNGQFGISTSNPAGSTWERGKSTKAYKSGTSSGDNAIVLGVNEDFYKNNTNTTLYLSNFDFSESGIYEFSFWGKWQIGPGDGMIVEYSTNNGEKWYSLGAKQTDWYNQSNTGLETSPYPEGTPFFGGERLSWTLNKINVSFLSGNANIAFRITFKSGSAGNFRGIAIDDIYISKYTETLRTTINTFTATPNVNEIVLNWSSQPEYYCKRYVLETSLNGSVWEEVTNGSYAAKGGVSSVVQNYTHDFSGFQDVYFFRLKVINNNAGFPSITQTDNCGNILGNPPTNYADTFYTDPIVVLRNTDVTLGVYKVYPNPFSDQINLVFNESIESDVNVQLFDIAGRLIFENIYQPNGSLYINIPALQLVTGNYVLTVTIGDREPQSFKLQAIN